MSGTCCAAWLPPSEEPIAGGRHKVFGHHDARGDPADVDDRLAPASCRRDGLGDRARGAQPASRHRGRTTRSWSARSATRRSTTPPPRSALNIAAHIAYRGVPLPLLLVCEDNGLGISVPTPAGWVEQSLYGAPGARASSRPTATTPPAALRRRGRARPTGCASSDVLPCSISAPFATSAHAGADLETAYRPGSRDPRRLRPRPAARDGALARRAGGATRERARGGLPGEPASEVRERAREAMRRPQLATADGGDAAARRRATRPPSRRWHARPVAGGRGADARPVDQPRVSPTCSTRTPRRSSSARTSR